MKRIFSQKKSGYKILDPSKPVVIRDSRGLVFYNTEPYLPRIETFNIPGKFDLFLDMGAIKKLPHPVPQGLVKLPPRERLKFRPDNFDVRFGNNPNKCSILWKYKTILYDNAYKEKPLPYCFFILYHEWGHHRYSTEKYADLFARNMMIKKGFNKSQVGESIIDLLGSNNFNRKEYIVNSLLINK